MGETEERVDALFRNFERKRKTTEYLRMPPSKGLFWNLTKTYNNECF